ncbi:aldose 1-epimerase family protein [Actinoplanes sp. NPDC051859]|uniref:aldose 1-epimerase family protein n=1 Tax=Actinoplanes sp. NPDC051859 TaxID=3363909 RepID=UPI00379CCDA5
MSTVVAAKSGLQWTIEAGGQRATVAEIGGTLREYAAGDHEVLDGFGPDEIAPASAGQLLAPWPNRIRDGRYTFEGTAYQLPLTEPGKHNAIHGLSNWARWRLAEQAPDAVTCEFDLPAQVGYPWSLTLRTRWRVGADGLRSEQEVTNTSDGNAPWGFSVHPYVQLPGVSVDDTLLRVPGRSKVMTDNRLLPIGLVKVTGSESDYVEPRRLGAERLDTTWGDLVTDPDGGSSVTVAAPGGGPAVTVWGDGNFKWWQVFTGDSLSGARFRRSFAIEPMTCPPDAFRSGRDLVVLAPGQTWRAAWGIRAAAR